MVVIHCAYTEQVNPAGATPQLSREQLWKGLQRKIRRAQDFVPPIEACDVIEDKGDGVVVREATFRAGNGMKGGKVREVCKSYYPTRVDFWQPSGAVITNTISDGPNLTESDYNMTYTFEWRHDDVAEGSEEHKRLMKQNVEGAKMAVHSSLEAMRKMAAAGELD